MSAAVNLPMLTIEDVATKTGVNLERLEQECSDSDLLALSELCDPWELIGQHLQLTDPQIRAIDSDHKTTEEKRLASLQKWKENKAFGATFKVFVDALLVCKFAQKARKVCEYRAKQVDSVTVHLEQSASDLHHKQVSQLQTRETDDESSSGRDEKLSDQVIDVASRYRLHSHDGESTQAFQTKRTGFNSSFTSKNLLTCPLCQYILRKPHMVQCCKQNFCKFCISRVQEKGGKCPKCNSNIVHHPIANKELEGALLQFEVQCENKCGWKGPLKQHDSHLNSNPPDSTWLDGCKEVIVRCIYCNCKSKRKYLLQRLEYRFSESKVDSVNHITSCVGLCAKWHDIGMELGFDSTTLQAIRVLHSQNKPEECYRDMLKEWIESSEDANWKNLLDVLRKPTMNFKYLATKIEQALLCDKAYDLRVNELTEEIDKCVMWDYKVQKTKLETLNSNLYEKGQELRKLQKIKGKKREFDSAKQVDVSVEKCVGEKKALTEHIQSVEFQLKGIRDHLKKCQELLQDEIIDLEFERNVKLQERGLGKPPRVHNNENNIKIGVTIAGLVGAAMIAVGIGLTMNDMESKELLLLIVLALDGGGLIGMLAGWLIVNLMAIVSEKLHEKEKKGIDEQYARLTQKCHDKIKATQPVIKACEKQLEGMESMDTFTQ